MPRWYHVGHKRTASEDRMKQISARQFRDTFGDLTESVVVSRRGPDGTISILGEWRPIAAIGDRLTTDGTRIVTPGFGHSSPAPKPGGKK